MAEEDKDKTAFFAGEGIFCYRKMPFGLKNAEATYQRLVDKVFSDQIGQNLEAYVDDIVIKSIFKEYMLKDIQETFNRFCSINMKLNPKKCSFGVEQGPSLRHLITKQGIRSKPSKLKAVTDLEPPRTLKDVQSLNGKLAALSRFLSKGTEKSLPFFKTLKNFTNKKTIQWTADAEEAFQKMKIFMEILPTLTAPIKGEVSVMYLAASAESISIVLLTRREEREVPIYFVSSVLQGAKLNCPSLEKLILALVHAARRLQSYFQAHPIMVLTNAPIKQTLILKDFSVEMPSKEDEKIVARKKETKKENLKLYNTWKLYTDGASSSDGSGAGSMLIIPEGKEYKYALRFKFETTNNEADLLPEDLKEARKIRIKASQYKLIKGRLYKKSFLAPWLRCIAPSQADNILREIHEGSCGFNMEPRYMVVKVMKQDKRKNSHRNTSYADLEYQKQSAQRITSSTRKSKAIIPSAVSLIPESEEHTIKAKRKEGEEKDVASIKEAYYQNKLCRYHNMRSNRSTFKLGDFVLLSLSNTNVRQVWQGPHIISEVYEGDLYKITYAFGYSLV
ncbi:reverse transcriptase domain-containing protein [Tanacetum coccineum]